jgi:O-antigen ligase
MIFYVITDLKFGVIVLVIYSFLLPAIGRFVIKGFPEGTILDGLLLLMLVGLVLRKIKDGDFKWASNPVSYAVWFWIIMNFLSLFNPLQSVTAWTYAVRGTAWHLTLFFILLEVVDFQFFKRLLIVWISLALLCGLYGLYQEFHGLSDVERNWVMNDPLRFKLYFVAGRWRIFSLFSDPTAFGLMMAGSCVFSYAIASSRIKISRLKRSALLCIMTITLLSAVYSGTRTAIVMVLAGILFHTLLTFQPRILIVSAIAISLGAGLILSDIQSIGPIGENSLNRVRSAFKPSDDGSFQVRERNQELIKPFIQSNPFGAGVGSIGAWGRRFTPDSELANFAPDSSYVRVAVELGWVGLILYQLLLGTVLVVGIRNYFKLKTTHMKIFMAGILAVIYAYIIADYPQQAIIMVPSNFVFFILMSAVVKLPTFETTK